MNNNFNDTKKLAEKIDRNSFCEEPNYFCFYSNEKAKEISKTGNIEEYETRVDKED